MSEEEFEKELKINDENWSKEIDRLREIDQNEIVKLRSIIKEVREYIERYDLDYLDLSGDGYFADALENILEILDKEKE